MPSLTRVARYPLGAQVTMARLSVDPYPILAELREAEPVSWVPETGMWFVTCYEDVLTVLADFETYTVDTEGSLIRDIFGRHMMTLDGAEQVRHKRQCMSMFRPKDLADTVGTSVDERVARLIDTFADSEAVELRSQLARPLAVETVAEILGMPQDHVPEINAWYERFADAISNFASDPEIRAKGRGAAREFTALVHSVLGSTMNEGTDSLLHRLAHSGDRLSDEEIISNCLIIMFGGIETTEAQLCNTVWSLLSHLDQLIEVREDSRLLSPALEESLRWQPSVQSCTRHATRDTVLRGVAIAEGEIVQCMLGSANRDPARFVDPDRYDIHRKNARDHLAFGLGRHFCLGAPLARFEIETAISALLERFSSMAFHPECPATMSGYEFRKPPELWMTLRP